MNSLLGLLSRGSASVLLFHKLPPRPDPLVPHDLDLAGFEQILDVVEENFTVVPLGAIVNGLRNGRLPRNAAALTFDDGYPEWASSVAPVLERRRLDATFYVATQQLDGVAMWHERIIHAIGAARGPTIELPGFGLPPQNLATPKDRVMAIILLSGYLKYLPLDARDMLLSDLEATAGIDQKDIERFTVGQLRYLHGKGFEIGSHTSAHPILAVCDPRDALNEISSARERLEQIVGGTVSSFAYPNGRPVSDFTSDHERMVRQAGYASAVTTQWGRVSTGTPVFQIPRFTPWGITRNQMVFQFCRNLLTTPRLVAVAPPDSPAVGPAPAPATSRARVLIVENGAGFGGAIVALQTLLANYSATDSEIFVATNLAVGKFMGLPAVQSHTVIPDRLYNFRLLARRLSVLDLGFLGRLLLFAIGRLDDVVNRLPYLLRLMIHALRVGPGVIHGNNEPNSNREAMLVAKLLGIPYVQHLRGPLGPSRHTPWLLARPNYFIPVSRWLAGELLVAGVEADRVRQIYDGVNLGSASGAAQAPGLRQEYGIAPDAVVIAMIGMLVAWKGQRDFIEAVGLLAGRVAPSVSFFLIGGLSEHGDAAYEDELRAKIAHSNLAGRIVFTGHKSDLPALLPEIDIVVSASTEPEPLGLVMLEAMASGCIFLGPAHGAATEVVRDGENGFLFVPRSARSLAEKLELAMQQRLRWPAMAAAARGAVIGKFDGWRCAAATHRLHAALAEMEPGYFQMFFARLARLPQWSR